MQIDMRKTGLAEDEVAELAPPRHRRLDADHAARHDLRAPNQRRAAAPTSQCRTRFGGEAAGRAPRRPALKQRGRGPVQQQQAAQRRRRGRGRRRLPYIRPSLHVHFHLRSIHYTVHNWTRPPASYSKLRHSR